MSFIDLERMMPKEVFEGSRIRVAAGERVMLSLMDLDAYAKVPPHSHPHEQAGMVLEGVFELTIGGETRTVRKGDCYICPPDVEHSVDVGDAPARALDIFSPPRDEYR